MTCRELQEENARLKEKHNTAYGHAMNMDAVASENGKELAQQLQRAEEAEKRLREALNGVKSTQRGYLCWCDNSWNAVERGHQPKCDAATEALRGAPERVTP